MGDLMNLLHLKYACEIEKTMSISKAAENLYMSQPNLSRAMKDLESSLNIQIFERTPKGMKLTVKGEEFLYYAKKILSEVRDIESLYLNEDFSISKFSISVPRASYISNAFTNFAKKLSQTKKCEIYYKETNSLKAINNILNSYYNLAIIRYQINYDNYFKALIKEKGFKYEVISEFSYQLFMSRHHPLAQKDQILLEDLSQYIEIAHADPYVPSLSMVDVKKEEFSNDIKRRIFVYERASQFELLSSVHSTYMWGSPLSDDLLDKYDLVQIKCDDLSKVHKDVLIYLKSYRLSPLDHEFLEEIIKSKRDLLKL